MDAVGVIHPTAVVAGAGLPAAFGCWQGSARTGWVRLPDTLHCNSDTPGSAAQFNQSVSAMPDYAPTPTNAPWPDTADTLSKR
jgi:hypothetical protein